jgi:OmpA-OmpF porin, OOP family
MTLIRKLLVASALVATGSTFAADTPGGYLLIAGGTSHVSADCSGTSSCDNNGNSFKLVGGWRLGGGIAIEGVALDLGKAKASVPIGSSLVQGELKSKGYGVGLAVYGDLSPTWSATARLGIASMKGTVNVSSGSLSGSDSKTSTTAYVGLGLAYRFTDTVSAELGFDSTRVKFPGDEDATVRAFTLGVGIRF